MKLSGILMFVGCIWILISLYYLTTNNYNVGVGPIFHGWMVVAGTASFLSGMVLKRKGK
jgi:hypothetical protein